MQGEKNVAPADTPVIFSLSAAQYLFQPTLAPQIDETNATVQYTITVIEQTFT